ncbi:MAG: PTS sugar transporter subunit IIB [bacterium]
MVPNLLWRKKKLVFPFVRVDDRLLHGQVIVGWVEALHLNPVLVACDRVLRDTPFADTLRSLIPAGTIGDIISLEAAAEMWRNGELKNGRPMIVLEHPVDALKLIRLGVPMKTLTLGGMHFREDRTEFLPYIFISEWDQVTLREIRQAGVSIFCQDLPATKPVPLNE